MVRCLWTKRLFYGELCKLNEGRMTKTKHSCQMVATGLFYMINTGGKQNEHCNE